MPAQSQLPEFLQSRHRSNLCQQPKEIYQIGKRYADAKKAERAAQFYQYVVDKWPNNEYALQSARDMAYGLMDANDTATADAAVDKLINDYSKQATLEDK